MWGLALCLVAGCSTPSAERVPSPRQDQIVELAQAIQALGPGIDPEEATRAARISYEYPLQLAREYGITESPIVHNIMVNSGQRPRGLCWHWAEDMEKRLRQEDFTTLDLHRAIANPGNPLRLEHSTAIVSAKGDSFTQGIVLDPWRNGGRLFWSGTLGDTRYQWRDQGQVHAEKRRRLLAGEQLSGAS